MFCKMYVSKLLTYFFKLNNHFKTAEGNDLDIVRHILKNAGLTIGADKLVIACNLITGRS